MLMLNFSCIGYAFVSGHLDQEAAFQQFVEEQLHVLAFHKPFLAAGTDNPISYYSPVVASRRYDPHRTI
jgi:hypothetical protein